MISESRILYIWPKVWSFLEKKHYILQNPLNNLKFYNICDYCKKPVWGSNQKENNILWNSKYSCFLRCLAVSNHKTLQNKMNNEYHSMGFWGKVFCKVPRLLTARYLNITYLNITALTIIISTLKLKKYCLFFDSYLKQVFENITFVL